MREITDLTDDEQDWVSSLVATLGRLGVEGDPESLDEFLRASRHGRREQVADAVAAINLVGAGIGELFVQRLSLRWVSVTDGRGARLAVFGESKKTLSYPMDAVARRWSGEPGSLTRYVAGTCAMIEHLRAPRHV